MHDTSGFQDVRSFIFPSPSSRFLHEQQSQFGTDFQHLLTTHDPIAHSTSISTKREKFPDTVSTPQERVMGYVAVTRDPFIPLQTTCFMNGAWKRG